MMLLKDRLLGRSLRRNRGYELWQDLTILQRGLDSLCSDIMGGIGVLVPPLEMVLRADMPHTVFLVTQAELRQFYQQYEGYPPIIMNTRSML